MGKDGDVSAYGFVVFCIVLVAGVAMLSNIVDSSNATSESAENPMRDVVTKVTGSVNSGLGFVVLGIGVLGAVIVLKGLDYF